MFTSKISVMTLIFLFFLNTTSASETDQFLLWDKELKDAKESFNAFVNMKFKRAIKSANSGIRKVSQKKCTKLADDFMSRLESNTKLRKISKHEYQSDHSEYPVEIYPPKNIGTKKYYLSSVHDKQIATKVKQLARTVNLGGVYFGTDKLTHFATIGRNYYAKYLRKRKKGQSATQAMQFAIFRGYLKESSILGLKWGTFSFSDLEANFQGMRLGIDICEGDNSYAQYINEKWEVRRPIDLSDYFNPAMDESFNLNYYRNKKFKKVVGIIRENHCHKRNSSQVLARMDYYASNYTPSMNQIYIRELIDADIKKEAKQKMKLKNRFFPTRRDEQTLDIICQGI